MVTEFIRGALITAFLCLLLELGMPVAMRLPLASVEALDGFHRDFPKGRRWRAKFGLALSLLAGLVTAMTRSEASEVAALLVSAIAYGTAVAVGVYMAIRKNVK